MISFPNAKINIGLYVTGKRDDGFHNIESIFYPVPFTDVLEILPSEVFSFQAEGIAIAGNPDDNLCVKAYRLLQNAFELPPVSICLLKNIPAGAGLGGGSSDASHTLKMLNEMFSLHLSVEELGQYAAALGSDCPFFIPNYPAYVFGRGEMMEAVDISLQGQYLVIICPGIHIATPEAFQNIRAYSSLSIPLPHLIGRDKPFWAQSLKNDFEPYAFTRFPILGQIKEELYKAGAFFASMSGSGSAVYGIFNTRPEIDFKTMAGWADFRIWEGTV